MNVNDLLPYIEDYGYFALFFCLWLGVVGAPIPDEVVAMGGGLVTTLGVLDTIPAFLATYLGVVSGLSLGFVLGKLFGSRILNRLIGKKKLKYLFISQRMIYKYGNFALIISYFIPIVRHVVPYIVGINGMSFKTYALYSYTTGFLWTLLYFVLGIFFGNRIGIIAELAFKYGLLAGFVILLILSLLYYNKKRKNKIVR
ncbi:DedA family protein [Sporosarcina sp. FA9]|uniref:DedA family protein n=1 Tax=Sporosarcina sp. FA9 TaxID=3413030 RepID=UPI003F6574F8